MGKENYRNLTKEELVAKINEIKQSVEFMLNDIEKFNKMEKKIKYEVALKILGLV